MARNDGRRVAETDRKRSKAQSRMNAAHGQHGCVRQQQHQTNRSQDASGQQEEDPDTGRGERRERSRGCDAEAAAS
jgi:hypothetical protein